MGSLLLVIDMQNDFITGALGTKEAENVLPKVVEKIRNHKGDVLLTRDTHEEDYLTTMEGKHLPVEHCIKGTKGWELEDTIRGMVENGNYPIIDKPTFGSLEVADYLKKKSMEAKWDAIEIVGLCTDVCVISNAMIIKAALPETQVIVDGTCCAGVTVDSHINALNAMKACQIEVGR